MPGLATRGSVFSWIPDYSQLLGITGTAPPISGTINLRTNTAPAGSSVDVPTWAAGVMVVFQAQVNTLGVGITYQEFNIGGQLASDPTSFAFVGNIIQGNTLRRERRQVIVPFFDEPLIKYQARNNLDSALGDVNMTIFLVGFVRNV